MRGITRTCWAEISVSPLTYELRVLHNDSPFREPLLSFSQELSYLITIHGFGEEKTLRMRTIKCLKFDDLTLVFNTLRCHVHAKVLSESDDRLNDLPRLGSPAQIADKTAIDLQGLDWELVQRTQ